MAELDSNPGLPSPSPAPTRQERPHPSAGLCPIAVVGTKAGWRLMELEVGKKKGSTGSFQYP